MKRKNTFTSFLTTLDSSEILYLSSTLFRLSLLMVPFCSLTVFMRVSTLCSIAFFQWASLSVRCFAMCRRSIFASQPSNAIKTYYIFTNKKSPWQKFRGKGYRLVASDNFKRTKVLLEIVQSTGPFALFAMIASHFQLPDFSQRKHNMSHDEFPTSNEEFWKERLIFCEKTFADESAQLCRLQRYAEKIQIVFFFLNVNCLFLLTAADFYPEPHQQIF